MAPTRPKHNTRHNGKGRDRNTKREPSRDLYYNPIRNGRRFLPIRRPVYPDPPTEQRVIDNILLALKNFDFMRVTEQSVEELVGQLLLEGVEEKGVLLPLGCYGIIDYDIRLQRFGPGSLNTEDSGVSTSGPHPPIVKLRFIDTVSVKGSTSTRLAIVLGRIVGPHQHKERLLQSRWIILLDQTRLLWALYTSSIDANDVVASKNEKAVPYSPAFDTAFGARKDIGQKVVLLGPLENIPFAVGKDLLDPQIHALDWSTTFVAFDQSFPATPRLLVSPKTVKRLLGTETSFFQLPSYVGKNMAWLKNFLRYEKFCKDLDGVNEKGGLVIGRTLAEAAWCKVVVRAYLCMDEDIEQREGKAFQSDLECLTDCLAQRRGESVFKYWLDKSIKYPGLDLVTIPDEDPAGDHSVGLKDWALTMLRENKGQSNTSFAFRCAVPSNVENQAHAPVRRREVGAMDLDGPSSRGHTEDAVLVVRAKAENEGLVRTVKESVGTN